MNPRISMITLGVSSVSAATKFYAEGLGFPQMESSPEVVFFALNGSWLGLYGRNALAEDAEVSPDGSGFRSFALAHNVNSEAEVDELIDQVVAAGAELTKSPRKTSWGGYSGYFRDPDGHLWEIAYNPHFWIGPKDTVVAGG